MNIGNLQLCRSICVEVIIRCAGAIMIFTSFPPRLGMI